MLSSSWPIYFGLEIRKVLFTKHPHQQKLIVRSMILRGNWWYFDVRRIFSKSYYCIGRYEFLFNCEDSNRKYAYGAFPLSEDVSVGKRMDAVCSKQMSENGTFGTVDINWRRSYLLIPCHTTESIVEFSPLFLAVYVITFSIVSLVTEVMGSELLSTLLKLFHKVWVLTKEHRKCAITSPLICTELCNQVNFFQCTICKSRNKKVSMLHDERKVQAHQQKL
jgi:hypothetical protein